MAGRSISPCVVGLLVASACGASSSPARGSLANTSHPNTLGDLCFVLERVIAAAPGRFESIRGQPIERPEGVDVSGWSASTLAPVGGHAVIVNYVWDAWHVTFDSATFSRAELANRTLACPVVAGWQRGTLNAWWDGEPAPLVHGRVKIEFHTEGGEAPSFQVMYCAGATKPCEP